MKKILYTILTILLVQFQNLYAQEVTTVAPTESADTLTSTVSGMRSELDVLKRIKIGGYIQTQFQYGDSTGAGTYAGGSFAQGIDKRFNVRRGRIKIQYDAPVNEKGISTSQYVLQFDVTERGMTIKDAYGKFIDPWTGWFAITAGVQNRPFGFEVPFSSSQRESPERGRMSQILFPGERDMGAMLTIQGPKTTNWNWLKLEAGLFNGNGAPGPGGDVSDFDKQKDFIGHLTANRTNKDETIKYTLGASYYSGGFRIDTVNVYGKGVDINGNSGFILTTNKNDVKNIGYGSRDYSKREYVGFDGAFNIDTKAGLTIIRAEYIMGKQPGASSASKSPNSKDPIVADIYNRNFNGAYFYFIQSIMQSPWSVIAKYDWYDPNTDVKGDEIGNTIVSSNFKATNSGDLKYSTLGLGIAFRWDANVKLTAYYDMVTNETSKNLSYYTHDVKDNVVTIRMQMKF